MTALRVAAVATLLAGSTANPCSASCGVCCAIGDIDANGVCVVGGAPFCYMPGCASGGAAIPCFSEMNPGTVSSTNLPLTKKWLTHGSSIWPDIPTSIFDGVKPFTEGYPVYVPPSTSPAGSAVTFNCPVGNGFGYCHALVSVYSCYPCVSQNGGLPGHLLNNDWKASKCGGGFKQFSGGAGYKLSAFEKKVAAGAPLTVTLPADAKYVSFQIIPEIGLPCADRSVRASCLDDSEGSDNCQWDFDAEVCSDSLCKSSNIGPSPPCAVCIDDEVLVMAP